MRGAKRLLLLLLACRPLPAAPHVSARFAVCLTGQLRTLSSEVQLQNVKSLLVDALPGGARVFAVLDGASPTEEGALAAARLGAVSVQWLSAPPLHLPADCPWKPSPGAEAFHVQASKVAACFRAVLAWELSSNHSFEYIVRTRPDVGFYAPISKWLHLDQDAVFTGYNHAAESCGNQQDFLAVVPRRHFEAYTSLNTIVTECSRPTEQFECGRLCAMKASDFGPECFLGSALARASANAFGCYERWTEPEVWAAPRQGNLFTLIRRACADATSASGWTVLFGESRCPDGSDGVPYDQFKLVPWTGEANASLPWVPDASMAGQDARCSRTRA